MYLSVDELAVHVNDSYNECVKWGGQFSRAVAAGDLKKRGIRYDSKILSRIVEDVKAANGVTRSRATYKDGMIAHIFNGPVVTLDDVKDKLAEDKRDVEKESKTYVRYVECALKLHDHYTK